MDQISLPERREQILELVHKREKLSVRELTEIFHVSGATIRADIRFLEEAGMIGRVHGGIARNTSLKSFVRNTDGLKRKKAIAKLAASLIGPGDNIIIDAGSTGLELAKCLKNKQVTAVVNDYEIARVLEGFEGVNIILIGGMILPGYHCTVGPFGSDHISGLTVDKAFLTANAFSLQKGAATPYISQAEMKRNMLSISSYAVLMVDSEKFSRTAFAGFADISELDEIITDNSIDDDTREALSARVKLRIAQED